jgi:short-chain fatty acids transporter
LVACLINWGFGLVVGAIFAKEVAKKVRGLDYRHLVAATYCGYVVWHGGLSGSIPLALATGGDVLKTASGGVLTSAIPISETIFSVYNIAIILAIAVTLPLLLVFMAPKKEDIIE